MQKYLLLLLLFYSTNTFAQQKTELLIPFLSGGKYGLVNKDKQLVIEPKYDLVYPFFSGYGLSMALLNNKPVIINRKGKKVMNGSTDRIESSDFLNSRLLFPLMPEVYSMQGHCQQDSCPEFKLAELVDQLNLFDKIGDLYAVSNLQKVFLINPQGKRKSEYFDKISHYPYGELKYAITEDQTLNKVGLLDENGKQLLGCNYDKITYLGKGVFRIKQNDSERDFKPNVEIKKELKTNNTNPLNKNLRIKRKNKKAGIVDSLGNILVSFSYNKLYPLNDPKFVFIKEDKVGILNSKEQYVYEGVVSKNFNQSTLPFVLLTKNAVFLNVDNSWKLIDIGGNQNGPDFNCVYSDYHDLLGEIAAVCIGGNLGVVDSKGQFLIPAIYDFIYCFKDNRQFVVRNQQKWLWLNRDGTIIYEGFDDFVYLLSDYLFVLKDGKWFYVNIEGEELKK